jgi:hypothetical protein
MADFIDVKSAKARGKRLSNYDIANIIDITPDPPEPEPEPETPDTPDQPDGQSEANMPDATDTPSADTKDAAADTPSSIPFTITNGESDVQLSLDL